MVGSVLAVVPGTPFGPDPAAAANGTIGGDGSSGVAARGLSADGRWVAFASTSSDLVAGDTNGLQDVFVFDQDTQSTSLVSVGDGGSEANGRSTGASISDDGRYVAFVSLASNLVSGDTNGEQDVFVRDLVSGTTTLVSTGASGIGNDLSLGAEISGDGTSVAFASLASNLVVGDTNGSLSGDACYYSYPDPYCGVDVFVRDLDTQTMTRESVSSSGAQADGFAMAPSISADGRYVSFTTNANSVHDFAGEQFHQIVRRDRQAGTTDVVSSTYYDWLIGFGQDATHLAKRSQISADGRFVAFDCDCRQGVTLLSNVFVRDMASGGGVTTVDHEAIDTQNQGARLGAISGDGTMVTFSASNPVCCPADTAYQFDRSNGLYARISGFVDTTGTAISADASSVAYNAEGEIHLREAATFQFLEPQQPPIGGDVEAREQFGACGCTYPTHAQETKYPVDTASGNFWHTFDDLAIPGRGPALHLTRSYNSLAADTDGPFGFGWSMPYSMNLEFGADTVVVHQGSGAQATFSLENGEWTAPPRVFASLVDNGDGTWTFTRQETDIFDFDATGRLIALRDLNGYETTLSYPSATSMVITDPAGRTLTFTYTGSRITSVVDSTTPQRTITYSYDGNGDLTEVVDVGGGHWTFTYDASHRMLTMRSPRYHGDTSTSPTPVVTNHYDAEGRLDWQTNPLGLQTSFDYSTIPGSTIVTDPESHKTLYEYEYGLLTRKVEGYGSTYAAEWNYRYDPATLGVIAVQDPNGVISSATYDTAGNNLTETDGLGRTATYTYNSLRQVTSVTEPRTINEQPITRTFTYDAAGNIQTESAPLLDSSGNLVDTAATVYHYDDPTHPGDVTSITDPNGNTTAITSDAYGNPTEVTAPPTPGNPAGNRTTNSYDADRGWLTATTSPRGNLTGADPADFTTTYDHDAYGRVTTTRNPLWDPADPTAHQTVNTYDADGNLETVTDGNGNTTTYVYDADGRRTHTDRADQTTLETTYNDDGTIDHQLDAAGFGIVSYRYDTLGRPNVIDEGVDDTRLGRDGVGNVTYRLDESERTTNYTYDDANQLVAIDYSDPSTPDVTNITYNDNGQRTSMTDGTGTSTWSYDSLGRLTSTTDGAGQTVTYSYDIGGRTTEIDYPGTTGIVTRAYDDANRLTTVIDWNSNQTTFGYDADSNLTTQTNPNGTTSAYGIDAAQRTMSVDHAPTATPTSPFAEFTYTRDGAGLVTSVDAEGVPADDHSWDYDPLNQLTGVDSTPDHYGYDAGDNLTTNAGTDQHYNFDNQLVREGPDIERLGTDADASTSGSSLTLDLPSGLESGDFILAATILPKNKTVTTPTGYVHLGNYASGNGGQSANLAIFYRIATGTETDVTLQYNASFAKSAAAVVYRGVNPTNPIDSTGENYSGVDTQVGASAATNHPGEMYLLIAGSKGTAGVWTPEEYRRAEATAGDTDIAIFDTPQGPAGPGTGGMNAYHSEPSGLTGLFIALRANGADHTYDDQGNRTRTVDIDDTTTDLDFDQEDRLTSHNGTTAYGYNGDGIRTSKTSDGVTTQFTWDTNGGLPLLLAEDDVNYLYGPGGKLLAQVDATGNRLEFHNDQLGSTRALTDNTGTTVATFTYNPYGQLTASTGTAATPFGFAGQYTDFETGLQYLRARYYDPETGQFLGRDPLLGVTLDPYSYGANSPLNWMDPSGEAPFAVIAGAIGGVVGGTAGAVSHISQSGLSDLRGLGSSVVGGAVGGAVTGACSVTTAHPAACGALGNVAGNAVTGYLSGSGYSASEAAFDAATGFVLNGAIDRYSPWNPKANWIRPSRLKHTIRPGAYAKRLYTNEAIFGAGNLLCVPLRNVST